MAGVGGLVAVYPARVHEAVGGLVGLHIADGAAGQVGPQAQLFPALALVMALQPIGVHALSGGMVGGEAAGGADLLLPLLQQLCQFLFHMAPP